MSLLSARWREVDVTFARQLAEALLARFQDVEQGGFYFTAHDQERLIYRPKPTLDDALPPGNGVVARALLQLGHLLGEHTYLDAAHNTLRWARSVMERLPGGHCSLVHALEDTLYPPQQIILRGPTLLMQKWRQNLGGTFAPWRSVYAIPYEATHTLPTFLPRLVSSEQQQRVTAFVCSDLQCSAPITSETALRDALT